MDIYGKYSRNFLVTNTRAGDKDCFPKYKIGCTVEATIPSSFSRLFYIHLLNVGWGWIRFQHKGLHPKSYVATSYYKIALLPRNCAKDCFYVK